MRRGVDGQGLRVRVLGGFGVWAGGRAVPAAAWRLRRAAGLVKLLALAPGHRLHRDQALEALWPGADPAAAAPRLHQALYVARRALAHDPSRASGVHPAGYLPWEGDVLALAPAGQATVDLQQFEAAAARARRAGDAATYREALDRYGGELLPDDRYADWAEARREAVRALHLALLVELAALLEAGGEAAPAAAALERIVAEDPAHEAAHVGLMRLRARAGDRREALRQYDRLREALRREVDAEPAAASRQLREDIRAGRFPAATTPDAPPAPGRRRPWRPRSRGGIRRPT